MWAGSREGRRIPGNGKVYGIAAMAGFVKTVFGSVYGINFNTGGSRRRATRDDTGFS